VLSFAGLPVLPQRFVPLTTSSLRGSRSLFELAAFLPCSLVTAPRVAFVVPLLMPTARSSLGALVQPPFSPRSSGPRAAPRPSRQKQIPSSSSQGRRRRSDDQRFCVHIDEDAAGIDQVAARWSVSKCDQQQGQSRYHYPKDAPRLSGEHLYSSTRSLYFNWIQIPMDARPFLDKLENHFPNSSLGVAKIHSSPYGFLSTR